MIHSEAIDDYLKIIFTLTREGGTAATGQIAERLGIAPASVTGMIKKLAAQDPPLVVYTKSRGVRLAPGGRARALEIIRHHRLLETFLHDTLGIPWDRVHEEAEKLEHYISEDLEEAIAQHLGDPTVDPHGAPIPGRDGSIPDSRRQSLMRLDPGNGGSVVAFPTADTELYEYLEGLGLRPGAEVVLVRVEPFGGPVYLTIDGCERALGQEVARQILVICGE